MKIKLTFLLLGYSVACYTLSSTEIEKLALEAESKITIHERGMPTGEMKIRSFLKEKGLTSKSDINEIMQLAFEIKGNPRLKAKFDKDISEIGSVNQDTVGVNLTDKEIVSLAREADVIWQKNGNMGEFAARKYLKTEKNITNKEDLKVIVDKILELRTAKNVDNKPKKSDKSDSINKGPKQVAEVPAEVQMWAQELRGLDPETQTFKIIKALNEEKVDKGLQGQILIRIRQLRSESPAQLVSDNKTIDIQVTKEEQSFYEIERRSDIQKIASIFTDNERARTPFIQIVRFKISNNLDVLWQDLVVYFYFTTIERPSEYGKEQMAYDWILKHRMDDVYKAS